MLQVHRCSWAGPALAQPKPVHIGLVLGTVFVLVAVSGPNILVQPLHGHAWVYISLKDPTWANILKKKKKWSTYILNRLSNSMGLAANVVFVFFEMKKTYVIRSCLLRSPTANAEAKKD